MNRSERHKVYMTMWRAEKREEHWKDKDHEIWKTAQDRAQGIWMVLEALDLVDEYCNWSEERERYESEVSSYVFNR